MRDSNQDAARQQDCFEGHERAERRERRWIEVMREGKEAALKTIHPAKIARWMQTKGRLPAKPAMVSPAVPMQCDP